MSSAGAKSVLVPLELSSRIVAGDVCVERRETKATGSSPLGSARFPVLEALSEASVRGRYTRRTVVGGAYHAQR